MVLDWNWIKSKIKEKIKKEKVKFKENRELALIFQKKIKQARQEAFEKEALKQIKIRARTKAKLFYGKKQKIRRSSFNPLIDSTLLPQFNIPNNKNKKRKRKPKNIWDV